MRRLMVGVVMALCVVAASPALVPCGASAQMVPDSATAVVEQPAAASGEVSPAVAPTGLPPRAAPPRTMADKWPVFLVFVVTWIGIVGYLIVTGRRTGRLAAALAALEERR